ncbi:hypothetical protein J1605_012574 [Eschrichtius robustus]|uniref:Uncharacterized protein n=1 Tax=Eschrichtius robustus TaxID=9764 RepID=A0AB34GLT0_ESCRO|nr:hypothetical protein J1605_012574 [Eschrichtius robustus]
MQNYKYDKAIVAESKNGGSPALNNNPRKGGSKRVLLICLDLFCLFMGEPSPAVPPALGARRASQPDRGCAPGRVSRLRRAVRPGGRPQASRGAFAPLPVPGSPPSPFPPPPRPVKECRERCRLSRATWTPNPKSRSPVGSPARIPRKGVGSAC